MGILYTCEGFDFEYYGILNIVNEEEKELIHKDEDAIAKMFEDSDMHNIHPERFIEKKYAYILARIWPENAKEHEARPWTEAELLYLASPENNMTPEEYKTSRQKLVTSDV